MVRINRRRILEWRAPIQFRTLCPMAADLLDLPWLSDRRSGISALPHGHPARDWLREQAVGCLV